MNKHTYRISSQIESKNPESASILIGQDSNAQIDREELIDDGEIGDKSVGKFALNRIDSKGRQLLNFVRCNNLRVANTFFKAKAHEICKSFNREGSKHQIDHVIVSRKLMSFIENCKVDNETSTHSDHSAIKTMLRLRAPKKVQKPQKIMNWCKFMKEEVKELCNSEISAMLTNCVDLGHEEFKTRMKVAAKKVAREVAEDNKGWFEFSTDLIKPLIDRRNELLSRDRSTNGEDAELKQQCRDAKSDLKDAVAIAKGRWIVVGKTSQIKINPKEAWDDIKILREVFLGHHVERKSLKFRGDDGKSAITDRENAEIVGAHFTKVFNRNANVDWYHANKTKQKKVMHSLVDPISFEEFNIAIDKACWHEIPGINGVSLNMIKA